MGCEESQVRMVLRFLGPVQHSFDFVKAVRFSFTPQVRMINGIAVNPRRAA